MAIGPAELSIFGEKDRETLEELESRIDLILEDCFSANRKEYRFFSSVIPHSVQKEICRRYKAVGWSQAYYNDGRIVLIV